MDVREGLRTHFGYPGFRPGQEPLVRAALEGRDALGILPTGGGKSVCYMLPAALLPGLTVVVSPLVSLMEDQVQRARAAGIPAALLNSTLGAAERRALFERLGRLRAAGPGAAPRGTAPREAGDPDAPPHLLLVAPERFGVERFRRALDGVPVSLLAIDEAHCISQWGHDFRPSYLALGSVRAGLGAPCLALTATATPEVRDEIVGVLGLRSPVRVVGSFDRPNLSWEVRRVRSDAERERGSREMLRGVVRGREGGAAVVYASTRRTVERLRDRWAGLGLPLEGYHGGMTAARRREVQAAFMGGEARIVVATNAFGMGVDKPDVRLVVHWDLPGSLEAYYQEAGRAGRDGLPARCVAFHARRDARLHRLFLDRSRPRPRTLSKVVRTLRREVGRAGRGEVDLGSAARRMGRGWSQGRLRTCLRALEASGTVRLSTTDAPEPAGTGTTPPSEVSPYVHVAVRPGPFRPDRARRLRAAGERRLKAIAGFASTSRCRRLYLLGYFGETGTGDGGDGGPGASCCDNCRRSGRPPPSNPP